MRKKIRHIFKNFYFNADKKNTYKRYQLNVIFL